jgi:hypothetical protein
MICATTSRVFAKNIITVYSGGPASIWSLAASSASLKELSVDSLILNRDGCKRQEREQMRDEEFALKVGFGILSEPVELFRFPILLVEPVVSSFILIF